MNPVKVFIPRDSVALALGAEELAAALQRELTARGNAVEIVRNGSRGLFWLEPLLEVETAQGRLAYGPVQVKDIAALLDAGLLAGKPHPLCHGLTDAIPWLARQERLTFARMGVTAPLSLVDYDRHGGWSGLRRALSMSAEDIVQEILKSGLRGRGGAAFPTWIKLRSVSQADSVQKYVVCNADEGDSGTYADRMILEGDPYMLIEGIVIAGIAVGADRGYVYVRAEYPQGLSILQQAIRLAEAAGFLGPDICGSGKAFHLEVRQGAGAYVCGEETALLESLEGRRGVVRARPPFPVVQGLFGQPTLVNNALTLACFPHILAQGGAFYHRRGVGRSTGTMSFQLAGNVRYAGLVELPFGISLRTLIFDFGGGTRSGRPVKAVQLGGPLGAYVPESQWDQPLDYESCTAAGSILGHGGIVVHDDTCNMYQLARHALQFCIQESCGKCTPCRIGSTRALELMDRLVTGQRQTPDLQGLRALCHTLRHASLCAMGGMTPLPVLSALEHYPADFGILTGETC